METNLNQENTFETEQPGSLVDRLERLSADSIYAHRASGLRGSLLRYVERLEASERLNSQEISNLEQLLEYGFTLLILSAEEVGGKA